MHLRALPRRPSGAPEAHRARLRKDPATLPSEYRPYRRFLSFAVLGFVSLGSLYLLAGVAVSIYRRRHVNPQGERVGTVATAADLQGCFDELGDVTRSLEKHLESFHTLLDHYDRATAQTWADEGARWRNEWRAVGMRCRFADLRGGNLAKEQENMAAVHAELVETETDYTRELRRFGSGLAPRLDRVRERLEEIGERLGTAREKESETRR